MSVLALIRQRLALATLMVPLPAFAAPPAPPPLDVYGDLPAVEEMVLSPSGANLAIIAKVKGERMLAPTRQHPQDQVACKSR